MTSGHYERTLLKLKGHQGYEITGGQYEMHTLYTKASFAHFVPSIQTCMSPNSLLSIYRRKTNYTAHPLEHHQSCPQVTLEVQSQVNSHCHSVKPMAWKCFGRAFISVNALLREHPSLCIAHWVALLDRRQRLLYQSCFTDDEKDHLGDRWPS